MNVDEVESLLNAQGDDLEVLLTRAGALRDEGLESAGRAGIITYSRKVFVPLTTLCRDRCHYCVFVDTPSQLRLKRSPLFMSDEQILRVVRAGQSLGCKEALLTLGDRPENRWPEARAWLDRHGYTSTLDYVAHAARLITAETGLLAHLNPGVMTADELQMLRPVAPSMGMMLETTSRAIFDEPGGAHFGSPDKNPEVRLQVIANAGAAGIPFTTGILVGIGETIRDRAESLVALRDLQTKHRHIQEVIVQNFRAKPGTAMRSAPDAAFFEYIATVAVARLVFGPNARIQAPPNLSNPSELDLLVRAGVDDWGGVSPLTADHVNPERPWPHLDDLAALTAASGFRLQERLTAHPEYVRDANRWIAPGLHTAVAALADAETGLAAVCPELTVSGTTNTNAASGHTADLGHHATPIPPVFRGAGKIGSTSSPVSGTSGINSDTGAGRLGLRKLVERAAQGPTDLDDSEWIALLTATGADLESMIGMADEVRRYTVGEAVSMVRNRNLTSAHLRATPSGPPEFGLFEAAAIARDAVDLGASEMCLQGALPASEDPSLYVELARTIAEATPNLHLHAYRPQDIADLCDRSGLLLNDALAALKAVGISTIPGTGVKVLSERVRAEIAPADLDIGRWTEIVKAAHRAGLRSSSVLFYGHVETASERITHLRILRALQDTTGGFTEFVPIPLPGYGVPLVDGRAPVDEHRAMVAVSRLFLAGSIRHIQIPWTRHGVDLAIHLLRAGGDDLGGTLMDGRVRPDTGVEQGLEFPFAAAAMRTGRIFRPLRERATDYREGRT
ncbi:7,8-didemethyl-8-hydroxy-5-deazariboflavin synthase CofG [Paenarthrobacter nitroguajacolicus]|uniref:7,8-didemethyl-8-hydroxy-5-deazariboflavin synthase CofG n=1 Tax=Paenarthrobacter nitroguajacolicus TaxID=211146 RepID=UPI002859A6AE|nr:7,8-didemethyl-8-hydroxy-5-deazariboflavin synthase CofG [Paenarthrobacter nitroguajacolicus]MDR6637058.1 FO synthase [Paenarthrobacter nitroguajacolicus]